MITVQLSRSSDKMPDEMARKVDEAWGFSAYVADIPSLEWAFEKWGDIVVRGSTIKDIKYHVEIYDDWRE